MNDTDISMLACPRCGSTDVQLCFPVWVAANEIDDRQRWQLDHEAQPEKDGDKGWCPKCETHVLVARGDPSDTDVAAFAPGSSVVITFNPFHEEAVDIVATVVKFERGSGFRGCDMATVRYERPSDGIEHELPFATYNLAPGGSAWLIERAERHEEQARRLRAMADEASR